MSSPQQNRSAIADQTLGADRELALIHVPATARDALRALLAIDAAMGDVVARSTDPALGRIKLAWWRERLEQLDSAPPPAEPRLQEAAKELLPGIKGEELAQLETGWATLLDPEIDPELVAGRGAALFKLAGRLLGSNEEALAEAGALYALASVGRRGVPALLEPGKAYLEGLRGHRFSRRVRPLTMLARAAARDLSRNEAEGDRGRALAMIAHRWSGRVG